MHDLLSKPAVSFDDRTLDVADLVLLGLLTGSWSEFERSFARRLELESEHKDEIDPADIRAEATAFRYAHGLISAADFNAWLSERSVTAKDLSRVLARGLLERRFSQPGAPAADPAALTADLADELRIEALCTGALAELASEAVQRLAAARALGERAPFETKDSHLQGTFAEALTRTCAGLPQLGVEELTTRIRHLRALDAALDQCRRELAGSDEIRSVIADHRLDWLRFEGQQLTLAHEGAAREARMLLSNDHLGLEEVCARAGAIPRARSFFLHEAPADTAALLVAAVANEAVGPWPEDGEWHLMLLERKAPPDADDPILRERALEELQTALVERHSAGRTRYLCVL